jgi:hypothetical protein
MDAEAEPQTKARGINRGMHGIRGKRNCCRFGLRGIGVLQGLFLCMHIFVGPLFRVAPAPPGRTIHAAHLLSDSLADLKRFAHWLELSPGRLRWSNAGVPHFLVGPCVRDIAIRKGAIAVSRPHLASLVSLWRARQRECLARLESNAAKP